MFFSLVIKVYSRIFYYLRRVIIESPCSRLPTHTKSKVNYNDILLSPVTIAGISHQDNCSFFLDTYSHSLQSIKLVSNELIWHINLDRLVGSVYSGYKCQQITFQPFFSLKRVWILAGITQLLKHWKVDNVDYGYLQHFYWFNIMVGCFGYVRKPFSFRQLITLICFFIWTHIDI